MTIIIKNRTTSKKLYLVKASEQHQVNSANKINTDRLQSSIEKIPIAHILWDINKIVLEWNEAAEIIFGYSSEELVGKPFFEAIVPQEILHLVDKIADDLFIGKPSSYSNINNNIRKDGKLISCLWHNSPIYDSKGLVTHVVSMVQDVSYQIQAEEALIESEEKYRNLVESNPYGFQVIDTKGTILYSNPTQVKMHGYTKEELKGKSVLDLLISDEERDTFRDVLQKLIKEQPEPTPYLSKNITKGGKIIDVEVVWTYQRDRDNKIIGFTSIITDITELKLSENALRTSDERFRTLMVQSPLVMEIYNLDGLQIEVNKAYEDLWGFPASTTVDKFNVLKSKEVEDTGLLEYVKRAYAGEAVTVHDYIFNPTGDTESGGLGRLRWLRTKIYPLRDSFGIVINIVITHEDITDHKQAEENRLEHDKLLRKMAENFPNSYISIINNDYTVGFTSGQEYKKQNLDPEQFIGLTLEQIIPEHAPLIRENYKKTFRGDCCTFEIHMGSQYHIYRTVPLYAEDGTIPRILVVVENITNHRRDEKALKLTNDILRIERSNLEEKNIVLKELVSEIEIEKNKTKVQIKTNLDKTVLPLLEKMSSFADNEMLTLINMLKTNLTEITSPFINKLENKFDVLTPREIEVCNMIKNGLSTKEIATTLNTSIYTVNNQRQQIRKKLNITGAGNNLVSFLRTLN